MNAELLQSPLPELVAEETALSDTAVVFGDGFGVLLGPALGAFFRPGWWKAISQAGFHETGNINAGRPGSRQQLFIDLDLEFGLTHGENLTANL